MVMGQGPEVPNLGPEDQSSRHETREGDDAQECRVHRRQRLRVGQFFSMGIPTPSFSQTYNNSEVVLDTSSETDLGIDRWAYWLLGIHGLEGTAVLRGFSVGLCPPWGFELQGIEALIKSPGRACEWSLYPFLHPFLMIGSNSRRQSESVETPSLAESLGVTPRVLCDQCWPFFQRPRPYTPITGTSSTLLLLAGFERVGTLRKLRRVKNSLGFHRKNLVRIFPQ